MWLVWRRLLRSCQAQLHAPTHGTASPYSVALGFRGSAQLCCHSDPPASTVTLLPTNGAWSSHTITVSSYSGTSYMASCLVSKTLNWGDSGASADRSIQHAFCAAFRVAVSLQVTAAAGNPFPAPAPPPPLQVSTPYADTRLAEPDSTSLRALQASCCPNTLTTADSPFCTQVGQVHLLAISSHHFPCVLAVGHQVTWHRVSTAALTVDGNVHC
jgi:hypothetical protein